MNGINTKIYIDGTYEGELKDDMRKKLLKLYKNL